MSSQVIIYHQLFHILQYRKEKAMQDQHALSVASGIRRDLPPKLVSQVRGLTILLVGEKTEKTANGVTIKEKGKIHIAGEAADINYQDKIVKAVQENAGGRQVVSTVKAKREDPLKRRHGFY